jgi:hypothetical protein
MEMLLLNERRAARRAVSVECQVVREADFVMLGERGVDLSTCGMRISSDVPAEIGEEVLVSLRIPGTDRWIDTRGKVARVIYWSPVQGSALGISFEPLEPAVARELQEALRPYPPVTPARPPRVDYAASVELVALS